MADWIPPEAATAWEPPEASASPVAASFVKSVTPSSGVSAPPAVTEEQEIQNERAKIDSFFPEDKVTPNLDIKEMPYPESLKPGVEPQKVTTLNPETPVPVSAIKQIEALPKTARDKLAAIGLGTASGAESMRANVQGIAARAGTPVNNTPITTPLSPFSGMGTDEESLKRGRQYREETKAAEKAGESATKSAADFASEATERRKTDAPGAITSVAQGAVGGAAMAAMAAAGGTPLMAIQGATEAYGNAKASGLSEANAENAGVRTLLALAAFGGSNSAVKGGVAKYLGNAPALKKFLVQALGQSAGNEAASRVISAYEAALDAPEGQRLKAATDAAKKFDIASTAQNLAFGVMGAIEESPGKPVDPKVNQKFTDLIQAIPDDRFSAAIKQYRVLPDTDPRKQLFENEIVRRNAIPEPAATRPTLKEVAPTPSETPQAPVAPTVSPEQGRRSALFQQAKAEATQPMVIAAEDAKPVAPVAAAATEQAAETIKQTPAPIPEQEDVSITDQSAQPITTSADAEKEQSFEDQLAAAVRRVPKEGRFGPNKVFINHAYKAWKEETGSTESLEEFKEKLLGSAKQGKTELSRADMGNKEDMGESKTVRGTEQYEFINHGQDLESPKPTSASKLVGPALTDASGEVLAKGKIGQAHVDLAEDAVEKALGKNAVTFDFEHGFHDEEGKVLDREAAADRALETGQIDKATYDKAMARKNSKAMPNNRGLHSEDLNKGVDAVEIPENPERDAAQAKVNAIKTDIAKNTDASTAWKKNRRKDLKAAEAELARHEAKLETPEHAEQYAKTKGATLAEPSEGQSVPGVDNGEGIGHAGPAGEAPQAQFASTLETVKAKLRQAQTEGDLDAVEELSRVAKQLQDKIDAKPEEKPAQEVEEPPLDISDPAKLSDDQLFEYSDEPWAEEEIARRAALEETPQPQSEGGDVDEEQASQEEGRQEGVLTPAPVEGEAVPPPSPETSKRGETTALKREVVDRQAEERGRAAQEVPERATPEERVKAAREELAKTPQAGEDLISRIVDRGDTRITAQDAATVLAVRRNTVTERNRLEDVLGSPESSSFQKEEARKSLEQIEARMERIDQASRAAGTEWSDIGRTYQMDLREDFSREGLERKERAQRGRPLTEEERNTIKEQADKIAELQAKLDAAKEEHAKEVEGTGVSETYERDIKDIEGEGKKTKKGALKVAREVVDRWKQEAEEEVKNLKNFFGSESGGVGGVGGGAGGKKLGEAERTSKIVSLAKVIRARVAELGLDRAEALKNAIDAFGEKVRPFFNEAWGESQKMLLSEKKAPQTIDQAKAAAKADAAAGEQLSQRAVAAIVRAHIRAGVHGEDALMEAAHKDIQEAYPDATERDVRRAYSDYGKVRFPNKEAVAKEAREVRTLVRLQESIDRETEGLSALHTGLQRDKATQSIREKTKQLNELLKKRASDPSAEQLASRDEAKQTALRNSIADLDKRLRTGEKPVKGESAPDSAATEQLRAERDAMVGKLREIEAAENPPKSEDQRKLELLQSRADELRKKIASGNIDPKTGKPTADIEEVAAARKEVESLNSQINEMRKSARPEKTPAGKQIEKLNAIKERLDDALSGKTDTKKPADWNPLSAEAETIQGEIDAMRELAAQMKRDAKPASDPSSARERAQIRQLEKSIEQYSERTARKDFSSKGNPEGPDSMRVSQLKEIRDSRRAMYEAVKKAGIIVRSPDEIYNERRLKQIQRDLKTTQDRLATDDVGPRPPRAPKPKFAAVAKAEAKLTEARQAIKDRYKQIQFENRSPVQKAIGAITGLAKGVTALAVTGHGGVGMFTHAGATAWRPSSMKPWGENFIKQFKLWASPEFHEKAIYELKNHPKFQFWKDAGSAINPDETYTDYGLYAKTLEKIPGMKAFIKGGKRGFDALKLFRLQLNENEWEKVPDSIKGDPVQAKEAAKYIAALNNKATGAAPRAEIIPERGQKGRMEQAAYNLSKNPIAEAVFFAPRLYASRFMRVAFDPFTTVGTFVNWKNETPAARHNAVMKLRNATGFAAGYVGALALNQAALSASGSQQKVNMSDPTKRDWLKFKAGDKEIIADGGLLDPMRLIGQVVVGDLIQNRTEAQKFREGSRFDKAAHDMMQYIRGKLNPTAGLVVDSTTGADFMGRPVPWSKEHQTAKQEKQHPQYTWPEWIASHGPIPLAGGAKIVYDELRNRGFSDVQARDFLKAAAYTAVGLTGVHISEDNSQKKKPFSAFR